MRAKLSQLGAVALLACATACAPKPSSSGARTPVAELRGAGEKSRDPDVIAQWLLGELIAPGGNAKEAARARSALGAQGGGMLAHLARGIDDGLHGRLRGASEHYMRALRAARESNDAHAPLIAWFAVQQAMTFRHVDPTLFERWRPFIEAALADPRSIGWRARAQLGELWQEGALAEGAADVLEKSAKLHGCASAVRLAGPFGRQAQSDTTRSFPAEQPGIWPSRFPSDPAAGEPPELLETERDGCLVSTKEAAPEGIYYAETFFTLSAPAEILLAVQGAYGVWLNDWRVLERDTREWGSWPRFGVAMTLPAGRHRVVARLADAVTSVRLLRPDGAPLQVEASIDASLPYSLAKPKLLANANVLDPYLAGGKLRQPESDLLRFVAATLASAESQHDVANVLLEPLLARPEQATGPVLALSALFTSADPIFSDSQRRDLVRELQERAVRHDPALWHPRLLLALLESERQGMPEAAREVRKLVHAFPDVPAITSELLRLYSELGWKAEYAEAALALAQRFPEDPAALEPAVEVLDGRGRSAEADALALRIQKLDPDREVRLVRALARQDYQLALQELKRIGERRPERKDIVERVYDVMVRAGNEGETWKKLEAAILQDPKSEKARLDLADARLAEGKHDALVRALLDAVENGAPSGRLEEALDLVEGVSELEPYRHRAKDVIAEYERAGKELAGTAARVLDYSVVWVHADGSSRMLEHEIIRVQSAEAITEMAEQQVGPGLMLHIRVIKKDGRILEPELVEGKPTLTMPHLELGDYIETERIESQPGDGQRGARFYGPRWYFREENIAYARSEFVVISPKSKPLQIETRNGVQDPELTEDGALVVRRWRVDHSPAAPVEPFGAPVVEFLPSVQVGWGVSLPRSMEAMADASVDMTPVDPRILRIAERIVEGVPAGAREERAKRLYRWLVANVEEGEESDGRRVIIGRNGNLWRGYIMLCRALGIPIEYAVGQSRLSLPPSGPFSEATLYTMPLLRVTTEKGDVWLTLGSKYAPFGSVPADVRGMPAYALTESGPRALRVPKEGLEDRVDYTGDVRLASDGSASVELVQTMHGKYATALRGALSEMPTTQIRDVIESKLLGYALRGARLDKHRVDHLNEPEKPLIIRTTSRVPAFAQVAGSVLLVAPPFSPRIGQLAALPARHTPLLVADSTEQRILLRVHLPEGARVSTAFAPVDIADASRRILLRDRVEGGDVILDRRITLPAGRVQVTDYPKFLMFARTADDALSASVRVRLGG